jgi:hypothetical protein
MTRALIHLGLTAALVVAPVLCCCKARALVAAPLPSIPTSIPAPAPKPVESCCSKLMKAACHDAAPTPSPAVPAEPKPQPMEAPHSPCACCLERPDAAKTEAKPAVQAAEPTGELASPAVAALVAICPEHLGLCRGLHPPDRAGVDVRTAALFERHVLRC